MSFLETDNIIRAQQTVCLIIQSPAYITLSKKEVNNEEQGTTTEDIVRKVDVLCRGTGLLVRSGNRVPEGRIRYGVLTCNHVVVYNGPKHQADFILNNGANYLDGQDWIEGQKKPLAGLHAVFGHFNCNGSEECHGTRKRSKLINSEEFDTGFKAVHADATILLLENTDSIDESVKQQAFPLEDLANAVASLESYDDFLFAYHYSIGEGDTAVVEPGNKMVTQKTSPVTKIEQSSFEIQPVKNLYDIFYHSLPLEGGASGATLWQASSCRALAMHMGKHDVPLEADTTPWKRISISTASIYGLFMKYFDHNWNSRNQDDIPSYEPQSASKRVDSNHFEKAKLTVHSLQKKVAELKMKLLISYLCIFFVVAVIAF